MTSKEIRDKKNSVKAEIFSAPFYEKPYYMALLVELIIKHDINDS